VNYVVAPWAAMVGPCCHSIYRFVTFKRERLGLATSSLQLVAVIKISASKVLSAIIDAMNSTPQSLLTATRSGASVPDSSSASNAVGRPFADAGSRVHGGGRRTPPKDDYALSGPCPWHCDVVCSGTLVGVSSLNIISSAAAPR